MFSVLSIILFGLSLIIGIEHVGIGLFEMFGRPKRQSQAFGIKEEVLESKEVRLLLGNQGIYNLFFGFLLFLYLLFAINSILTLQLFLLFVLGVGIYGGATVSKKIWLIQSLPAALALLISFILLAV